MNASKHTFKAGTIEIVADDNSLRAQETREQLPLSDRLAGLVTAAVFFGAASFFWFMPVENPDDVLWIRALLCGGLAAISLVLVLHAVSAKTSFRFVEVDLRRGLLISGHDTKNGREVTNHMRIDAIENIFLGSEALNPAGKTLESTQALYVTGKGAPKKNILLVGTGTALNEVKAHMQRLARFQRSG